MEEHALTQDTTRRMVIGIIAGVQAVVLFFGAQIGLRIFQMRDQLSEVQTSIARIEERQANYALLFQNKIDNLRYRLNRLENTVHHRAPDAQSGAPLSDLLVLPTRGDDGPPR